MSTEQNEQSDGTGTEGEVETSSQDQQTEQQNRESDGNSDVDIAELLSHAADSLGDNTEKEEGEKPSKPDGNEQSDGGAEGDKDSQKPKPGDEGVKPEEKPQEQSLKDVLKEVLAERAPKEETQEKPKQEEPKGPKYAPSVPNEIMAAMESEDPKVRQQGVSALIGGAMNKVYADLKAEVTSLVQQTFSQVPQILEQRETLSRQAAEFRETFYGENPEFGKSEPRKKLVAMTAVQLAQSMGKEYKGFTPEFRTKLADAVSELTGLPKGKGAPGKPPEGQKPPKDKQGFQAGAKTPTRGSEPSAEDALRNDIADTIGMTLQ